MSGLACDSLTYDFFSADGMLEQKLQHLALHTHTAHPVQQHQGGGISRCKVDRPTKRPLCDLVLAEVQPGGAGGRHDRGDLDGSHQEVGCQGGVKLDHWIKLEIAVHSPRRGSAFVLSMPSLQVQGLPHHTCQFGRINTIDYAGTVIHDQLVRCIADQEILANLLGDRQEHSGVYETRQVN